MDSKLSETVDKLKSEKRIIARKVFEFSNNLNLACNQDFVF